MRAIIIEDKDAKALVQSLALDALYQHETNPDAREKITEIHRRFHYVVVTWLQDQGAKVTA